MKKLLLLSLLVSTIHADKFVFHFGYHTDTVATALNATCSATDGVTKSFSKEDALFYAEATLVTAVAVYGVYKLGEWILEEK